jgi:hypothetical protein
MDMFTFALDKPINHCPKLVIAAHGVSRNSNHFKVAWEAPLVVPKVAFHTQSRYARAIPTWELQAPENCFNLASLLQVLEEVDEACVLTVRKIHKLGLNSAQILREHFSQYGEIDRVMLLPSRPKSNVASAAIHGKVRPASMAFVVMRSRQPAIVARLNEIHIIEGHPVQVQKFKRDPEDSTSATDVVLSRVTSAVGTPVHAFSSALAGPNGDMYSWMDEDASTTVQTTSRRSQAKFIN